MRVFCSSMMAVLLAVAACGPASKYKPAKPTPEELEWEEYHDEERLADFESAKLGYLKMCERRKPYARACYDYARLQSETGSHDQATEAASNFILKYPDSALAQSAVKIVARTFKDLGEPGEGIGVLEDLARKTEGKDVWDSLCFAAAGLARLDSDSKKERELLERITKGNRWRSQLWNDSMWRLIESADERGDRDEEKRLLVRFIESREESHVIASYAYSKHDDAMLRLGKLYFEDGLLDKALLEFMALADWKTSRMRDDGYMWAAKVLRTKGDNKGACDLLLKIVYEKPAANTRREALSMIDEIGCAE